MTDYKKGKIYKIECQETNRIYIGSTCQPTVAGRLRGHKYQWRDYKKGKGRCLTSFSIIETGNYKCLLLCNYPCNTKDELTAKEAEYIQQYRNDDMYECVNKLIPYITEKERMEWMKQYREDHKEEASEYKKQYRKDNKEKIREADKKYYQNNKEEIKDIRKVSHVCACGSKYTMQNKARHEKTTKHMKWEATQ